MFLNENWFTCLNKAKKNKNKRPSLPSPTLVLCPPKHTSSTATHLGKAPAVHQASLGLQLLQASLGLQLLQASLGLQFLQPTLGLQLVPMALQITLQNYVPLVIQTALSLWSTSAAVPLVLLFLEDQALRSVPGTHY